MCPLASLVAAGVRHAYPTGRTTQFRQRLLGGCSVRQIELVRFATDALERLSIPYAVVGSFASSAWGEPA